MTHMKTTMSWMPIILGKNKKANTNMATLHTDTKTADRKKNFYFLDYVRIIFYAVFIFHIKKNSITNSNPYEALQCYGCLQY